MKTAPWCELSDELEAAAEGPFPAGSLSGCECDADIKLRFLCMALEKKGLLTARELQTLLGLSSDVGAQNEKRLTNP